MWELRLGGRIGAGAILAAVALAVPSLAWGLKTRAATAPLLPGKATAKCKDGERIVSGGFRLPDEGQVTISRAARGQGWTATADGEPPLTVFAYCTTGQGVSRNSHSEIVPGPAGTQETVAAHCGVNKSLVSGGYETVDADPGTHDLVAFKSRRTGDRTWKVTVFNDSDTASRLKVFAYCKRDVDVKGVRTATGLAPSSRARRPPAATGARRSCPAATSRPRNRTTETRPGRISSTPAPTNRAVAPGRPAPITTATSPAGSRRSSTASTSRAVARPSD